MKSKSVETAALQPPGAAGASEGQSPAMEPQLGIMVLFITLAFIEYEPGIIGAVHILSSLISLKHMR